MQREEKKQIIEELSEVFKNPVSVFVIEYRGLNVNSMQSVREQVKDTDAELRVVKNKFLLKACEGTEVEKIKDLFAGPTAIAICGEEFPATAKVFTQARKQFEQIVVKGGLIDGKVCGFEEIEEIAKLPSRQTLISIFASTLATPLSNFVGALDRMRSGVYYALESLKQKKDAEEPAKETAEIKPEETQAADARTEEAAPQADSGESASGGNAEVKAEGTETSEAKKEESESEKGSSPAENTPEKQSSEDKNKKEENSDG
ncbi:MAG: 50S ribosomal protein L10 [Candidatus Mycalebacterium zealandia]|nr:MAG: 50S ribosomal protein L10 [Candidatus Mycalebacterium zealandia]